MVPTHQPMLPPVPGGHHWIPTSRCVSSARPPWVPVLEAPRWSQVRFLNGWRMGTRRLWDVDSFLKVLINRQTCGDLDFLIFFWYHPTPESRLQFSCQSPCKLVFAYAELDEVRSGLGQFRQTCPNHWAQAAADSWLCMVWFSACVFSLTFHLIHYPLVI